MCVNVCVTVCESPSVRAVFQSPSVSRPLCPLCVMSVKSSLKLHVRNYVHLHTHTNTHILAQTCIFIWHFKCMTLLKQLQRLPPFLFPLTKWQRKDSSQKDALIIFAQSFLQLFTVNSRRRCSHYFLISQHIFYSFPSGISCWLMHLPVNI